MEHAYHRQISEASGNVVDPSSKGFEDYLVVTYDDPNQQSSMEDYKTLKNQHIHHRSTAKSSESNYRQVGSRVLLFTPKNPSLDDI